MKKTAILFLLLFSITVSAIQITEIMYDFPARDEGHEWIEVYSDSCINLEEWKFYESETNHRIKLHSGSAQICKDYAIIADKPTVFLQDHPDFSGNLFDSSFTLLNTGETLAMKNPEKEIVEEITYQAIFAKGDGFTLERNVGNWFSSTVEGGTPGQKNSIQEQPKEEQENSKSETIETPPKLVTQETIDYGITDDEISKKKHPIIEREPITKEIISENIDPPTGAITAETTGIKIEIDPIEIIKSILQGIWETFRNAIDNLFITPIGNNTNSTV